MRISVVSLNLWNTEHIETRMPALKSFLNTYDADIFLFQEIRPVILSEFKKTLPNHDFIAGKEPGWMSESNIFYKKDLFTLLDYGRLDLNMPEKDRGVFWIKLRDKSEGLEFYASTVHLTWQGNADEIATGLSYRHAEAHIIAKEFPKIFGSFPVFLTGDFNDPLHPGRILREAGFDDVFSLLREPHPVTFPCLGLTEEESLTEAIDKIMSIKFKPILASSPRFYMSGHPLSDHYPVAAVLELG